MLNIDGTFSSVISGVEVATFARTNIDGVRLRVFSTSGAVQLSPAAARELAADLLRMADVAEEPNVTNRILVNLGV